MSKKEELLEQYKEADLEAVMGDEDESTAKCNLSCENAVLIPEKKGRRLRRAVSTVFSVLLVLAVLVAILFQFFPDLRARVLNKCMDIYESQRVISFEKYKKIDPELVLTVGWLPDGFEKVGDDFHSEASWKDFYCDDGASMHIEKMFPGSIALGAENPETKIIKMHGYDATLMTESEEVYLIWLDEKKQIVYHIYTDRVPVETTLKIAENIS